MGKSRMKAESGREAGLELCSPAALFGQEGQRTLKLEERITQLFVDFGP
jgi:hypothetical protein